MPEENCMHSIPNLKDLAFRQAKKCCWEKSRLPSLIIDHAFKIKNVGKKNRLLTDKKEEEYRTKTQSALQDVEDCLMMLNYIPFRIKVKLLAAIASFNEEVKYTMVEVADAMRKCLKRDVKYCLSKIVFTENDRADLPKTILNIMKESQLKIEFRRMYLAQLCINTAEVRAICENVLMEEVVTSKWRKCKEDRESVKIGKINGFKGSLIDCLFYWEQRKLDCRFDYDERFLMSSDLQYVAALGPPDALQFFYQKLSHFGVNTEREKKEALMEAAKFAFLNGVFSREKIVFFYSNLQEHDWTVLLRKYFSHILLSLLGSWHYRYLCPKFFKDAVAHQDTEQLKELYVNIADLCDGMKFEYYEIVAVIQSLWSDTPQDVKEDFQMCFVVIPRIVLPRADFGSLVIFLRSYMAELQRRILGHVIFGLITSGREGLLPKCLESAGHLDLRITDCRELISKESFKEFLVIDAQFDRKSYGNLDSVTKLLCSSELEKQELKKDIFSESSFLVELLVNLGSKEDFDKFLSWGLNTKHDIEVFKKNLQKELIINDVYDRRLIENKDLEKADKIFGLLKLEAEEISNIKRRVRENPIVVRLVLTNLLENDALDLTGKYLEWLFETKEQRQKFMDDFIFSDDGKNAIFDMLLTIDSLENSPSLRLIGRDLMLKFLKMKELWLRPFRLSDKMNKMLELEDSLRDVVRHRPIVKDIKHLSSEEKAIANVYSVMIFKSFKVIVKRQFTEMDLNDLHLLDISRVVIYLEREESPTFLYGGYTQNYWDTLFEPEYCDDDYVNDDYSS